MRAPGGPAITPRTLAIVLVAGGALTIAGGLFATGVFDQGSSEQAFAGTNGSATTSTALLNAPPAAPLDPTATQVSTELDPNAAAAETAAPETGDASAAAEAPLDAASPTDVPQPTQAPPIATAVPPTPAPTRPPAPTPTAIPPAPPASVALVPMEQAMFDSHNVQRQNVSLSALTLDARLVQVARRRAQDMASKNYFSHTSPSGETAFTILGEIGYPYQIAGENIARNNYPDGETVQISMAGFMNSPGHRANILEPQFKKVGIGVAFGSDGMKYFAVVFSN